MAMRHIRLSRHAQLTALTLALAVLAPVSAALAEGFYYEATTRDQIENGKERSRSLVRGWIDGANAKIEFADQKGTMFKPGSYLLTKDAGRTLYLVDPKEKAYSRWDLEAMLASTFALMEGMGPLLNIDGEIIGVNQAVADAPERVNQDPYAAWLFRILPGNPAELATLLVACPDRRGIVAGLAQLLYGHGANILDSDQHVYGNKTVVFD